MTFPTTSVLDNFNRSDANPLNGDWTNGWWGDSSPKIVSNQLAATYSGYSGARYNTICSGADCEVFVTVSTLHNCILALRVDSNLTSPSGYYLLYEDGATGYVSIKKIVSGSATQLDVRVACTLSAGDKLGFEIIGTTLKGYRYTSSAWSEVISRTDSTYTSAGYMAVELDDTTIRLDDFGGGDVVTATGITKKMDYYGRLRR